MILKTDVRIKMKTYPISIELCTCFSFFRKGRHLVFSDISNMIYQRMNSLQCFLCVPYVPYVKQKLNFSIKL